MLKSMTGYGEAGYHSPDFKVDVQIKSLNHRYLDPVFNLPEKFLFLEDKLRNILSRNFSRGRLNVFINFYFPQSKKIAINKSLAKEYSLQLKDLNKELKLANGPRLETLLSLPGVIEARGIEKEILNEKIIAKILEVFQQACRKLRNSEEKEGRVIFRDLNKNIGLISKELAALKKRIKIAFVGKLKSFKIEEEKEAFLRDKDITEEVNRIDMHLKSFRAVLNKNTAVGKELDFILQELQRETNTIGAKSFDSFVSKEAVLIKTEIEKLREQVQNVE